MNPTTQSPPLPRGFERISMREYRERPALSRTDLSHLLISPDHFKYYKRVGVPDTPEMLRGRAFHALLEGDENRVKRFPGAARSGKAWEEYKAEHGGEIIVLQKEWTSLLLQRDAFVAKHRALLDGAVIEASAFATRPDGVAVKARPDMIKGGWLYDFKSTSDATAGAFGRSAARLGYLRQAAWYLDVVELATGIRYEGFAFLVCENDEPHDSNAFYVSEAQLAVGRRENEEAVEIYRACERSGRWPGFPTAMQPLSVPQWALS